VSRYLPYSAPGVGCGKPQLTRGQAGGSPDSQ